MNQKSELAHWLEMEKKELIIQTNEENLQHWMEKIRDEISRARERFPAFHSSHEGWAVILEEVDELWHCIKINSPNSDVAEEAVQIAAMSLCFLMELCER